MYSTGRKQTAVVLVIGLASWESHAPGIGSALYSTTTPTRRYQDSHVLMHVDEQGGHLTPYRCVAFD